MPMAIPAAVAAVVLLLAAGLGMAWIVRRLPKGPRGTAIGFGALLAVTALAFGLWIVSIRSWTSARYVCIECGRTERRTHLGPLLLSSAILEEQGEYARRFAREHEHDWHVEGCIDTFLGVGCTMHYADAWYRDVPKLVDHAAAEALVREIQALPVKERWETICAWDYEVAGLVEFQHVDLDAAFLRWNAARRSR